MAERWSSICNDAAIGPQGIPTSKVELSISCRNLVDLDILSKSDPQCFVYQKDLYHDRFYEIGRTEEIRDNLNPDFVKKIILDYNFESVQKLRFELWDIDPVGKEFLGQSETTLGEIVAYRGRQFKKPLVGVAKGRNYGEIIVVVEELVANKQVVKLQLKGSGIKGGFFFSCSPFLTIWKSNEDNTYSVVHKTEVCKSTNAPLWRSFTCPLRSLCNGDVDRQIRIDCMNYKYHGNHKLIGSFNTSLRRLQESSPYDNVYSLSHPRKPSKSRGKVEVIAVEISEESSFLGKP